MELKAYIEIFKKEKNTISTAVLVLLFLVTVFSGLKSIFYENDMLLLISRNGTQNTADYKYDGYYAVQASDVFADNISQWLSSASVASEIYTRAGVENKMISLKDFSKVFKADKLSSQYVRVRYETNDKETAVKLAHAITDVLQEKADLLSVSSTEQIGFKIIYSDPLSVEVKSDFVLNGILAIIGGLFLGAFIVLGKNYFTNEK
jgi:capsular polysaccharide biosynthesis protein